MASGAAPNLIGARFGRLVVIARLPNQRRHTYWRCVCDCGNTADVAARHLVGDGKHTRSCGCLRAGVELTAEYLRKAGATRKREVALQKAMLTVSMNPEHRVRGGTNGSNTKRLASLLSGDEAVLSPRDRPAPAWGRKTREALDDLALCFGYPTGGR